MACCLENEQLMEMREKVRPEKSAYRTRCWLLSFLDAFLDAFNIIIAVCIPHNVFITSLVRARFHAGSGQEAHLLTSNYP